jgi:hypothetical protein
VIGSRVNACPSRFVKISLLRIGPVFWHIYCLVNIKLVSSFLKNLTVFKTGCTVPGTLVLPGSPEIVVSPHRTPDGSLMVTQFPSQARPLSFPPHFPATPTNNASYFPRWRRIHGAGSSILERFLSLFQKRPGPRHAAPLSRLLRNEHDYPGSYPPVRRYSYPRPSY